MPALDNIQLMDSVIELRCVQKITYYVLD